MKTVHKKNASASGRRKGDLFIRVRSRSHVIDLYRHWLVLNKPLYSKYFNIVAILFMAILIPFDFLLFQNPLVFVRFRVVFISLFLVNLLLLEKRTMPLDSEDRDRFDPILILPALLFVTLYSYFLLVTRGSPYSIVVIANYMVIFLSTFFLHRFWREQYTVNLLGIYAILMVAAFRPEITTDCLLLVIFHISSLIAAFLFRREFVGSLYERFNHLSTLVPRKVARYIVISHGKLALEDVLEARKRFTVCLCADWRDYQKLAETHEPDYISRLFEGFYDIVFEELDALIPEGNYYASWTADELFVIFYSEKSSDRATMVEALRFAHALATTISERVREAFEVELAYDIGLASGVGLVGLQGPTKLKKTTLTGKSAGTAKRLETEGKALRNKGQNTNPYPILVMDDALCRTAWETGLFQGSPFTRIVAETKNIRNQTFYMWQNRTKVPTVPGQSVDFSSLRISSLN